MAYSVILLKVFLWKGLEIRLSSSAPSIGLSLMGLD